MNQYPGLEKEDCDLLGFVVGCLFSTAISLADFRQWCQLVIRTREIEAIPAYFFELESFDEPLTHIYEAIGFNPGWKHTESEWRALYGIAAQRGIEPFDWPVAPETALRNLAKNPKIAARFRETFPFIQF